MNWNKYFKAIEMANRTEINQELRNVIKEHLGSNLNIYTEQDLCEQTRKVIQEYTYRKSNKKQLNKKQ